MNLGHYYCWFSDRRGLHGGERKHAHHLEVIGSEHILHGIKVVDVDRADFLQLDLRIFAWFNMQRWLGEERGVHLHC